MFAKGQRQHLRGNKVYYDVYHYYEYGKVLQRKNRLSTPIKLVPVKAFTIDNAREVASKENNIDKNLIRAFYRKA